jgi:hypothetical protein
MPLQAKDGYGTKLNGYIEGGVSGPASKSDQFSEVVGFIMDANSGHRASLASSKKALGSAVLWKLLGDGRLYLLAPPIFRCRTHTGRGEGVRMKSNSPAVLVVYNPHRRDAGTIPVLLTASGPSYNL